MAGCTRSPLVQHDLEEIWLFIARDNPVAADNLLDDIDQKITLLTANPGIGRLRSDIALEARSWAIGNYVILYKITNDGIEIVRVLHGARDLHEVDF